jgi:hypothetical protein
VKESLSPKHEQNYCGEEKEDTPKNNKKKPVKSFKAFGALFRVVGQRNQ